MPDTTCSCGSGKTVDTCCGPILAGGNAPTAEALMRSRYTAHVQGDIEHIVNTHDPATRDTVDRALTEKWARQSQWKGLTIINVDAGGAHDETGTVEFSAHYSVDKRDLTHHERSRFRKLDGQWFYVDGDVSKATPIRAAAKVERNAPCPCGSGTKYKRCHGA